MRRRRAFKRGRLVSMLVAGSVGYVVGNWNAVALRSTDLSAAQTVSLRFPVSWRDASAAETADEADKAAIGTTGAAVVGDSQLALLSPEPMIPQTAVPQAADPQTADPPMAVPQAAGPQAAVPIQAAAPATAPIAEAKAKMVTAPAHHRTDRPGFMLNDAQIASIRQRLHLTMDQERMWPAVEAALRNMVYAKAHDAHRHGAPVQVASADPNSVEVQGLKSAAIPLLMSFNAEQKDEVRNLVHVMGLDQLASQF
jgi:hypothetical protein